MLADHLLDFAKQRSFKSVNNRLWEFGWKGTPISEKATSPTPGSPLSHGALMGSFTGHCRKALEPRDGIWNQQVSGEDHRRVSTSRHQVFTRPGPGPGTCGCHAWPGPAHHGTACSNSLPLLPLRPSPGGPRLGIQRAVCPNLGINHRPVFMDLTNTMFNVHTVVTVT